MNAMAAAAAAAAATPAARTAAEPVAASPVLAGFVGGSGGAGGTSAVETFGVCSLPQTQQFWQHLCEQLSQRLQRHAKERPYFLRGIMLAVCNVHGPSLLFTALYCYFSDHLMIYL